MVDNSAPAPGENRATSTKAAVIPIQSLQRGIQILNLVAQSGEPLRLATIARDLGMDRASAFRLLQTLEQNDLVYKDPATKSYSTGYRLMQWAASPGATENLIATVRPYLELLAKRTGESGHFGILRSNRALLLDYAVAQGTIVVQNRVGIFEPLYCTALGKTLLAFQPAAERERLLAGVSLERRTDTTIVDPIRFEQTLQEVRTTFIAHDDGEYDSHLYCVAAPVIARGGRLAGAIGVSMVRPIAARKDGHIAKVVQQVRNIAERLTSNLGGVFELMRSA